MKVLVVHRQSSVLESIKTQLGHWYVRQVTSGLDGLLASRMERFDLILCGMDLPVVTGIEMARAIRNFSYNRKVPIIMLADGSETPEHFRIINMLDANLLTLQEISEMKELNLETE